MKLRASLLLPALLITVLLLVVVVVAREGSINPGLAHAFEATAGPASSSGVLAVDATPSPTPTPGPATGLYRNTSDGYSVTIPAGWGAQVTGEHEPVFSVDSYPDVGLLIADLWMYRLSELQTSDEWVLGEIALFGEIEIASEAFVELGPDTTGYQVDFTWDLLGVVDVREIWVGVVSGTRAFLIRGGAPVPDFALFEDDIQAFLSSFTVETPSPFGASQDDSLFQAWGEIVTLDPALYQGSPAGIPGAIFGGLVMISRDLEAVPDIAETWDVSPDGVVYTFHLRPDAVFHDGRPVTAGDVVYSWERAADPATESPTVRTYLGDIVGVKEMLDGEATSISGLKALDDLTLEVTIDAPRPYFIQKLTYPTAYVVDRSNVESGEDWTDSPNGSGPFKLKSWVKDDLLVLERNELYHLGIPRLKHSVYQMFAGRPLTMYEQGEIDTTGLTLSSLDRALDPNDSLNKDLMVGTNFCTSYIAFNVNIAPFDDPLVRRAFAMAVDLDKELAVTLKGAADRATGIIPPGMSGYNPSLDPISFDPVRARALLDESSYGGAENLPPIISFTGDDAIHWSWREYLGVEVEAVSLPESQDLLDRSNAGEFPVDTSGWCADYPDPQNFLEVLFHSESDQNNFAYANPEVDALLERAGVESDHETRMAMYQEAERLILADGVVVPMWHGKSYSLTRPYVKGYELTPIGVPMLQDMWIER